MWNAGLHSIRVINKTVQLFEKCRQPKNIGVRRIRFHVFAMDLEENSIVSWFPPITQTPTSSLLYDLGDLWVEMPPAPQPSLLSGMFTYLAGVEMIFEQSNGTGRVVRLMRGNTRLMTPLCRLYEFGMFTIIGGFLCLLGLLGDEICLKY